MKHRRTGDFLSRRVQYIPLARLRPNPQQPRRRFDEAALRELEIGRESCRERV